MSWQSTFLSGLMGECRRRPHDPKGTCAKKSAAEAENMQPRHMISGVISYASQSPWIQQTTVRENILFGAAMNEDR